MHAICILEENDKSGVNGVVEIEQITNSTSRIVAKIKGLKKGKHGFHIHEFGNLTEGCKTAGSHYNPLSKTHGGPGIEEKHMGDLGNIESQGEQYEAEYNQICEVQLEGPYSVFGRSIVVHAQEDDLGKGGNEESKKTGNAGARLACGIIARSQKKQQK
uniref:Superoxide dismutase [Cu-Zn] n=1 Tax=Philasterides dicentrarchi TaxID=282688 RepID=A0A410JA59_9CILI|nr:Cu/Zn superoxide dismutase [Philasterides dicentrarchi]QBK46545.1 copper/zinc superoxide dismutase [Philasterides dicentrarchi]